MGSVDIGAKGLDKESGSVGAWRFRKREMLHGTSLAMAKGKKARSHGCVNSIER